MPSQKEFPEATDFFFFFYFLTSLPNSCISWPDACSRLWERHLFVTLIMFQLWLIVQHLWFPR